jgi:hypothetical protein
MRENFPYKYPEVLPRVFQDILSYWKDLRRGQAEIPFTDDIRMTELSEHENDLIILDVFAKPQRYRFSIVGQNVTGVYRHDVAGIFLDELEPGPPFRLIHSQASAAVEMRTPTYYVGEGYARLLLPAWGDGHVSALLGKISS